MPAVLQQRDVPESIRALAMARPDYVDLFTVTASDATDHSPEAWARAALEGASPTGRFIAWRAMCGLRLDPRPSPDNVAGWRIADRGDGWIRAEASSRFMTAHAVLLVEDGRVSLSLFVRYDRPMARLVWPAVSIIHQRAVPGLLRNAVRRINRSRAA
ncbi:MAG: hypothetical protein WD770_10985 [Actinomycetota bacterium]